MLSLSKHRSMASAAMCNHAWYDKNSMLTPQLLVVDLAPLTQGYPVLFDRRGNPLPSLALSVPSQGNGLIARDGKTIAYKLRRGVFWHDGTRFTSADIAQVAFDRLPHHTGRKHGPYLIFVDPAKISN